MHREIAPDHLASRKSLTDRTRWHSDQVEVLISELDQMRSAMLELESAFTEHLQKIPLERRASARNLLHYIALRNKDIRSLQVELVRRGLSSLGRCESNVIASVDSVLSLLQQVTGEQVELLSEDAKPATFTGGRAMIDNNTQKLLGEHPGYSGPVVMVTMPSTAAEDYSFVRDVLEAGMGVMRINCAHDNEQRWLAMINNLRRAERELGRSCRVAMDLSGPKIRTGPIEPGPQVLRWRPQRDAYGRVTSAVRIWIALKPTDSSAGCIPAPNDSVDVVLPADDSWRVLEAGDELYFTDASGRRRKLRITQKACRGFWAESKQTTYVTPDTVMHRLRGGQRTDGHATEFRVGGITSGPRSLFLRKGDRLTLTHADIPGRPASYDDQGKLLTNPSIGCTLPEIFQDVRKGHRILFDDGKIAGIVEEASSHHLVVEITRARARGDRLRSDKGINLPDTDLQLPALTAKDIQDLQFVAQHADIVNFSFVRRSEDLEHLQRELKRLDCHDLGIVLKIENRQAFENLPVLLVMALRSPASGVMIARGDLAVECGWERLAELQEEILWMCEAAHVPVIWATQVLEGLAKKGLPSRAEITDAAMGARAECVMLNKGPNIVHTVRSLRDILARMQEHQVKKRPMFRRLEMVESLLKLRK